MSVVSTYHRFGHVIDIMSSASALNDIVDSISNRSLPPVSEWQPEITRDIDIFIARNGDWFYLGSRIQRQRMVQLFSSVLRVDEGQAYLVTPQERLRIKVEDAPFTAVLVERYTTQTVELDKWVKGRASGSSSTTVAAKEETPVLVFTTNLGDKIIVDEQHPITVDYSRPGAEPAPYVLVRDSLKALINRSAFYQLADWAEERPEGLGVLSCGRFMLLSDPGEKDE